MDCRTCQKPFNISEPEKSLLNKILSIPGDKTSCLTTPTTCPDCRMRLRLAHRNERFLYHRELNGKKVLSLYHPDSIWGGSYSVIPEEEWRSDSLDLLKYGREIDFTRPFFEQYWELQKAVPRMLIVNLENENCPYTTHTGYSKNCYLIPCSEHCEGCMYGRFLQSCKDCLDCTSIYKCELCYEGFALTNCYACQYLSASDGCSNCYFSENLTGCTNCLFCTNLVKQNFCIFNKQVSEVEFKSKLAEILGSRSRTNEAIKTWHIQRASRSFKYSNITSSQECSGDYVSNSKNSHNCFDLTECEDCYNTTVGFKLKDCLDCNNNYLGAELNYQVIAAASNYNSACSLYLFRSRNIFYSEYVYDSNHLFGCVGAKRGSYQILNKQYEEAEYFTLVKKLISHMKDTGEWGEYFPAYISPFGYNESVASDYFPMDSNSSKALGFNWREEENKSISEIKEIEVPDQILQLPPDTTSLTLTCSSTKKPFKVTAQEIKFYREQNIAVPNLSPTARHQNREQLRNPREFVSSKCSTCQTSIVTNVLPERIVLCEACYQKEVFS